MPCDHCKAGKVACDLTRDRVFFLNHRGRVAFFAPETVGVGDVLGMRIDKLVQPTDKEYVLAQAGKVLHKRTPVMWLIRDVWDVRTWLTHAEPAIGPSRNNRFAVATSRPVCQMIFSLSPRQRQILRELIRYGSAKALKTVLGISHATIRSHLSRAAMSACCSDLTELMRWANDMQHALSIEDEIAAYLTRRQT